MTTIQLTFLIGVPLMFNIIGMWLIATRLTHLSRQLSGQIGSINQRLGGLEAMLTEILLEEDELEEEEADR